MRTRAPAHAPHATLPPRQLAHTLGLPSLLSPHCVADNIYDTCGDDDMDLEGYAEKLGARRVEVDDATSPLVHPQLKSSKLVGGAVNDYACGGNAVSDWLSQDSVAKALHVKTGTRGMNYTWGPDAFSGDLRPTYKDLIAKYRIMIYSGDTDACIPQYGSEQWTRELGYPVAKPW